MSGTIDQAVIDRLKQRQDEDGCYRWYDYMDQAERFGWAWVYDADFVTIATVAQAFDRDVSDPMTIL
jgi:hypothetical protein